jgi:hypothetical protein
MPHWISETLLAAVNAVPALFVEEGSPNFTLIRAMFVLIVILLIISLGIWLRPYGSALSRRLRKAAPPDKA